ncbi:ABC transporter permease [uncultured Clostridium sp.]|uniref:ABC transporter permease n=1 Tax=uncultured Clostridium sp. TaxID=59620 RepID=UPI0025F4AE05|nr:ABC transporter permease [uncultured Clostridium sp.]
MKSFITMLKIELKLSIRDMNMILFAIIMPSVILSILGIIYHGRSAFEASYYSFIDQSFGALCSISICAGSVMGLPIMISDYREKKILKRFKTTPVSPIMILMVNLLNYSLYALCSMILLWVEAKILFGFKMYGSWWNFIFGWILVLFSMFSIGMFVGGIAKNSKQASIIACILYFPMLIFSGAKLPYEIMPKTLQIVSDVMPLTQGIKILKNISLGQQLDNMYISMLAMIGVAIIFTTCSIKFFKWE